MNWTGRTTRTALMREGESSCRLKGIKYCNFDLCKASEKELISRSRAEWTSSTEEKREAEKGILKGTVWMRAWIRIGQGNMRERIQPQAEARTGAAGENVNMIFCIVDQGKIYMGGINKTKK